MIVITAKFQVRPEHADEWPRITADFTRACNAEDGCLWFEWSRSVETPDQYVLIEAFRDEQAGAAHVGSPHFKAAQQELPRYLASTPHVINTTVEGEGWSELGEMTV